MTPNITVSGATSPTVQVTDGGDVIVNVADTAPSVIVDVSTPVSGTGDVTSSSLSLDNQIVRFDGTSGKVIQNSGITIADGASGTLSGTNTGDQNLFGTIAVSGQSDIVADSTNDTLTFVAGSNITITTDPSTDAITIAASGSGSGTVTSVAISGTDGIQVDSGSPITTSGTIQLGVDAPTMKTTLNLAGTNTGDQNVFSTFAVAGQSNVVADSTADTLTLVAGSNITITTDASTDSITINSTASSSGDVVGPASATDNAIARFDQTTGKLIQNSGITIADGATGTLSGTNSGDQNLFGTIAVSGQSNVVADSTNDTLTLVAGSNITITTDAATDSITINSTASGSGDVVGPASSTDNALVRFDGTTGKLVQNGQITESDTGDLAAVNSITMDTTPSGSLTTQGQMMWNNGEETLDIQLNGFALHVGEHVVYHVKNSTGSTIAKGVPVMFAGTTGNSGQLLIQPWDGTGLSTLFMGLTAESLTDGSEGFVIAFGKLRGIETDGANYGETWADGDIIYAGTTAGSLTNVTPSAPDSLVQVAAVVHAHASNGTLFIRTTPILGDVFGPASATDGNVAVYDGTTGKVIKNGPAISTGGNGASDNGKLAVFDSSGGLNAAIFTSSGASSSVILDENGFRYTDTGDGSYSWLGNSGVILNDGTNTGTLLPPTSASVDVNMPSTSGTLISTGDTGTVTPTMLSDAQLISLAALSYTGNAGKVVAVNGAENNFELITVGGTGTVTSVAISGTDGIEVDSGSPITSAGIIQLGVNAATMKTTLDLSGTNSGDVTLSGTPDYITISGQTITRGLIDLTTDVTGDLPLTNFAQASAASKLLGRGSASGAGDFEEITLGSGLSMSGTTLSASGGSSNVDVKLYTANDTWTNPSPSTAKRVFVKLIGGGAGGGSGRKGAAGTNRYGGSGGAPGATVETWFLTTDLASTISVTIGAGGGGGASVTTDSTDGNNGTAGGTTTFSTVSAVGGLAGVRGTATSANQPGGKSSSCLFGLTSAASLAAGSGSNTTGASVAASVASFPTGGGGGGGLNTSNTTASGGTGGGLGESTYLQLVAGGTAGAAGNNGGNGNSARGVGTGGGGGGSSASGNAGAGGNGGGYGSGGGGGGASTDAVGNSGAGGNGAGGYALIITYT